jgi:hypothetical protein
MYVSVCVPVCVRVTCASTTAADSNHLTEVSRVFWKKKFQKISAKNFPPPIEFYGLIM